MLTLNINLTVIYFLQDKEFIKHAQSVSRVNTFFLKEQISSGHFLLLTQIVARKIKGEPLPNIKWLQTELQISFTKVKRITGYLESRGFITKISDPKDKRRKFLDVTGKGHKYIWDLINSIDEIDATRK